MEEDIITLSSDEDIESPNSLKTPVAKNNGINKRVDELKNKSQLTELSVENKTTDNQILELKIIRKQREVKISLIPEVVDLVNCTDKSSENSSSNESSENDTIKNHSKTSGLNAEVSSTHKNMLLKNHAADEATSAENNSLLKNNVVDKTTSVEKLTDKSSSIEKPLIEIIIDDKISLCEGPQVSSESEDRVALKKNNNNNNITEENYDEISQDTKNQISNKSLNIFREFVDYCGSLEENPKDREKLIGKLNKYYAEAEPQYVKSKKFKSLIKKCKNKIHVNNLYLVAKTISDELKLRKVILQMKVLRYTIEINELQMNLQNIKNGGDESAEVKGQLQAEEKANDCDLRRQEKRLGKIQKIIKKLNHLGYAIRELEKQEVDLSDEEDSVYLKLQRFRERYWIIYKKLSEFTSGIVTNRVFDEKIHFTETKYPAINRCIEKWLNKTKSFPDFADILKILENKSAELNLPTDKDALRFIAIEIFQKVGAVLQRKRKYDLWNSFCDFLEEGEDPAVKEPKLEKIFKLNYAIRVKKEQEIYELYAERQEKELHQPKEISEEEAYRSPESGNEEEEEIINIEESVAERLLNASGLKERVKNANDDDTPQNADASMNEKETKNNFRNCKSLKWRLEKGGTPISESSDNSAPEGDVENKEKKTEASREKKQSSPDLILLEPDNQVQVKTPIRRLSLPTTSITAPVKRSLSFGKETCELKKKSLKKNDSNNVNARKNVENVNKTPVFDVGYCQIVTNYNYRERRKVFRDLTNLNRLMKKPGLRKKMAEFFPTLLYSRYSFKKETPWKKRFKINLSETKAKNQKCALNEEEKTGEKISFTSNRDSEKKDSQDNADGGRQGADFSGQGNGQEEEDNNDKGDENRKNGKVEDENEDCEEEEDEEKEGENAEVREHSSNTQKTEKENEDSLEPNKAENHKLHVTEKSIVENNETNFKGNADRKSNEENESKHVDGNSEKSIDYQGESGVDIQSKFKDSEDAEEFENLKNSLEPICVLKEGDASDEMEKVNNESSSDVRQKSEEEKEKFKTGPFTRSRLKVRTEERSRKESRSQKRLPGTVAWTPPLELPQTKPRKMSTSDEERVKRFLLHSPSSISITPPKKLTLSKPPSESALQALATLRNLKGISATIVKAKPKKEEVPLILGQTKRQADQSSRVPAKRRRPDLPVISNVQSVNTLTPKIVTVQGNVSGFENLWPETRNNGNTSSDSSSIKISKVWGSLPRTMTQSSPSHYPGCSFQKSKPGTSNQMRKKSTKKQVEYVVLD